MLTFLVLFYFTYSRYDKAFITSAFCCITEILPDINLEVFITVLSGRPSSMVYSKKELIFQIFLILAIHSHVSET